MSHKYISYNVANSSSLSGLNQLLYIFKPVLIFIQETTLSTEQLLSQINGDYQGLSNINPNDSRKPGNAVLWKTGLEVVVNNVVPLRLQSISCKEYGYFMNIYAPTGSQGLRGSRNLFRNDIFPILSSNLDNLPIMIGDWNCSDRKEDTEGWESMANSSQCMSLSTA